MAASQSALPAIEAERPSFEESKALFWAYTENQAPMQVNLQRRTSELTLNTPPAVQTMTQLQIAAAKAAAKVSEDKKRDKKYENVLAFTEEIIKAQLFQGDIYDGFSNEEKEVFKEQVNTPPADGRIEWLGTKLYRTTNLSYEVFVNILCYCHVESTVGDNPTKRFVQNYVHQKHMLKRKYQTTK